MDLFQSRGHCWVFQICWHIECSTSTASSFRIWNSSTGIPSPPLALFAVMLPKAHLTSNSRMSGSRSVITPSWLSGTWRSFWRVLMQFLATSSWYLLLLLGAYLFWVDFPIKQELLHSVSCYQCVFQSKMLTFVCSIMVEIQVCLFLLWKSHEDTGVPLVSGIFSVISLVSCSQCKCLL